VVRCNQLNERCGAVKESKVSKGRMMLAQRSQKDHVSAWPHLHTTP
jgi:hypothetical protein